MKNIKFLIILFVSITAFNGCDDPGTEILWSASLVEIDAATTPSNSRTFTYLREDVGATPSAGFNVNLAAVPQSEAIVVNFEILNESTAVEGLHYSVSGSSVTFAAGENVVELPININVDNINDAEVLSIVVRLTSVSSGNATINEVYREGTHNIQIRRP